jgi:hypothetical protein
MNIGNTDLRRNTIPNGMRAVAAAIGACLVGAALFYAFFSGVENGSTTAHAAGSAASAPTPLALWALALARAFLQRIVHVPPAGVPSF